MVGRIWIDVEERYFWRTAVAQSSKRAGIDRSNGEKTWDHLATDMQRDMTKRGIHRREYTGTMLFEHYFQNIEGQRQSPNAGRYVHEYLDKIGPNRAIANQNAPHSRRRTKKGKKRAARAISPTLATPTSPQDAAEDSQIEDLREAPSSALNPRHGMSLRPLLPALPSTQNQPRMSPASPPANGPFRPAPEDADENDTWGYQMGKRYASGNLSAPASSQSRVVLADRSTSMHSAEESTWRYQERSAYAPQHFPASTMTPMRPPRQHYGTMGVTITNDEYSGYYQSHLPATPNMPRASRYWGYEAPRSIPSHGMETAPQFYTPAPDYSWQYQVAHGLPEIAPEERPRMLQTPQMPVMGQEYGQGLAQDLHLPHPGYDYGYEAERPDTPVSNPSSSALAEAARSRQPSSDSTIDEEEETLFVQDDGGEEYEEENMGDEVSGASMRAEDGNTGCDAIRT